MIYYSCIISRHYMMSIAIVIPVDVIVVYSISGLKKLFRINVMMNNGWLFPVLVLLV